MAFQNGKCGICPVVLLPQKGVNGQCVDHCHDSLKVRGFLCTACNQSLGHYEKYQRANGLVLEPYEQYLANPPAGNV